MEILKIELPDLKTEETEIAVSYQTSTKEKSKSGYLIGQKKHRFYAEVGGGFRYYPVDRAWKPSVKEFGYDLLKTIWKHKIIQESIEDIMKDSKESQNIHIVFSGKESSLSLPLELMCECSDDEFFPLVLDYPMSREIVHKEGWCQSPLKSEDSELPQKILLVNSNVKGVIEIESNHSKKPSGYYLSPLVYAEQEIEAIKGIFDKQNRRHTIKVLNSPTFEELKDEMDKDNWNIIHYVGHGGYSTCSEGIMNGIFLKGEKNKAKMIDALRIKDLFEEYGHEVKFVYLDCCEGIIHKTASNFIYSDYLGIMQGLVKAKVPSFLGFRWRLKDEVAKFFAVQFYESLVSAKFDLRTALFKTRKYIYTNYNYNNAYMSSVLVINNEKRMTKS